MISIDDVIPKEEAVVIDNFMSDLYIDSILQRATTHPIYGGLIYAHTTVIDDIRGSLQKKKAISVVEDENTLPGRGLSHSFDTNPQCGEFVAPLKLAVAELEQQVVMTVNASLYVLLKDNSFGKDNYHPPRVSDREGSMKTLTLFLDDTDCELLLFDKTYIGATPKKLKLENRYSSKKGTAVIMESNRYFSTVPSSEEDSRIIQYHYITSERCTKQGIGIEFLL